uniref:Sulfotransferase domain-containing protein n=2 Tax=Lotharella globosa TaxID=91324 RepID=A0A7S3ZBB8_9EUKA
MADPKWCGVVFHEPGWTNGLFNEDKLGMYANVSAPFWDAYTTILLVREPWDRYFSHLHQLSILPKIFDSANPSRFVNDRDPVFGDKQVALLRRNFITQHLVPGFRFDPTCTEEALEHAKKVVDAFDLVLDMKYNFKTSSSLVEKKLGIELEASSEESGRRWIHNTPLLEGSAKDKFMSDNRCDYAVVEHARMRMKKLQRAAYHEEWN